MTTNVISVSPFRCRMWDCHERLQSHITDQTCRDEMESVSRYGQRLPVLGRPIANDLTHDIELIYGARRLFIAQHLNLPLMVDLREVSNREAIIALDIENRQRKDLSPYERGRSFSTWLREGLFASQDELAQALNISASQVSRLLKLAQLPAVLVNAFSNPTQICENWGRDLMELWKQEERRSVVAATARVIAKESTLRSATEVYQRLIGATDGRGKRRAQETPSHTEVIKDTSGNPLFRISVRTKDIALVLPIEHLSTSTLKEIKSQVASILQHARIQGHELSDNNLLKVRVTHPLRPIGQETLGKIGIR